MHGDLESWSRGVIHVDPGTKDYTYSRTEVEALIVITGALLNVLPGTLGRGSRNKHQRQQVSPGTQETHAMNAAPGRGLTLASVNDEDGPHFAELLRVLDQSGAWAARIAPGAERLQPAPRSPLRGDDDRAHPYELSHAAWHSLSHAVDHLSCLHALLRDAKVVHMYAPFSLVRAALENACAAVWMLQPPRRANRLTRRPRFAVTDIRNGEQVKQLTGQPGPHSEQERMQEVRAIAARAGIAEAAVGRGAPYSEIVQTVGDSAGPAASVIYLSWKLCSVIAHGDFWPTWSAMQRVELPGAPEGTGSFRIEANVKLLMYVTTLAANLTRQGWQLYDQRCRPPS